MNIPSRLSFFIHICIFFPTFLISFCGFFFPSSPSPLPTYYLREPSGNRIRSEFQLCKREVKDLKNEDTPSCSFVCHCRRFLLGDGFKMNGKCRERDGEIMFSYLRRRKNCIYMCVAMFNGRRLKSQHI